MKLKNFLKNIEKLVEQNPKILEYTVIYSIDDEGNSYHEIPFPPALGYYDEDNGFHGSESEYDDNSICIN